MIQRVMTFIDYWNFQLSINNYIKSTDWKKVPEVITKNAWEIVKTMLPGTISREETRIYSSYNPNTDEGRKHKKWCEEFLRCIPGVHIELKQQKRRKDIHCSTCHKPILNCPHCKNKLIFFREKGIDIAIATDMFRLAWENAYDIAILVSSDSDFIHAVRFLNEKGKKVIHAGFYPTGSALRGECWFSLNLNKIAKFMKE
jgi:uncharacterized LabA/DUF88 family protein